jgi:hypothetical protein
MVQQIYESIKASKPEKDVRILLVGLVFSLEDIDSDVTKTLQQLCSLYNEVEMHLVYAESSNSVTMNQMRLEKAGCHVTLVDQENLLLHSQHHPGEEFETNSRFQKLALLRSLQRLEIIQWQQYRTDGIVVIVDLDIMTPPPLYSLMHAIHRVNGNKHTQLLVPMVMKHGILLGARCDCIMIRLHRLIETANGGIVPMLPTFGK